MSRRRKNAPSHRVPPLTATTEDFSDQELDFFRRGDELHPPAGDTSEAPDSDA